MKNYSTFTNNFTYGRDLVKKLVIVAAIACVLGLLTQSNPTLQIYTIIKYCRCPSCNKVIFFGLLAAKTCPRCKRSLTTGQKVKKSKAAKY